MTNSKSTKRALLGSAVALLLCFTMLLGTTFAWFTDSATSGNNIIKTGNLDMKLSYKPYGAENTEWTEVTESTVLFGEDALYEPGYTEAVWLKVENLGSLAFRYDLAINVANEKPGTNKDGDKFSLSDYLEVKYMTTTSTEMESNFYTTRESLDSFAWGSAANSGVASLKDEIAVIKNGVAFSKDDPTNGAYNSAYVLVVISMPTTVGNEANHDGTDIPQIDFSLTALATQLAYESDSFGSDYDKDATYPDEIISATELYNSTLSSGSVKLGADMKTSTSTNHYNSNREYAIRDGVDYTIDLNGHTINHDGTYQNGSNTGYTYLYTVAYNGKLTIDGEGTIRSANSEGFASVFYAQSTGEIVINGGDINVDKGIAVWAGNGSVVTINGGSFISTGSDDHELIYSSGGIIHINGGFFHNTLQDNRPVNVANANRGTGYIYISGGTFVNFDPSTGGDDPSNILVVDGYKVVSETQANGDVWYTVVAE